MRDLAIIHKEEEKEDLRQYNEEHNRLRSVEATMGNRYVGMGELIKKFLEGANGFHWGLVRSVGTGFPGFDGARRETDEAYERLRARIDDIIDSGEVWRPPDESGGYGGRSPLKRAAQPAWSHLQVAWLLVAPGFSQRATVNLIRQ